ncbi:hypothetical protein Bca4012_103106 [Brassica carinata]
MQPSCAQVSPKHPDGALTPERAAHSCVHGYHGSWLDIIHPFSTAWPRSDHGKIRENDNTWLDDQPLLPEGFNRASISKT